MTDLNNSSSNRSMHRYPMTTEYYQRNPMVIRSRNVLNRLNDMKAELNNSRISNKVNSDMNIQTNFKASRKCSKISSNVDSSTTMYSNMKINGKHFRSSNNVDSNTTMYSNMKTNGKHFRSSNKVDSNTTMYSNMKTTRKHFGSSNKIDSNTTMYSNMKTTGIHFGSSSKVNYNTTMYSNMKTNGKYSRMSNNVDSDMTIRPNVKSNSKSSIISINDTNINSSATKPNQIISVQANVKKAVEKTKFIKEGGKFSDFSKFKSYSYFLKLLNENEKLPKKNHIFINDEFRFNIINFIITSHINPTIYKTIKLLRKCPAIRTCNMLGLRNGYIKDDFYPLTETCPTILQPNELNKSTDLVKREIYYLYQLQENISYVDDYCINILAQKLSLGMYSKTDSNLSDENIILTILKEINYAQINQIDSVSKICKIENFYLAEIFNSKLLYDGIEEMFDVVFDEYELPINFIYHSSVYNYLVQFNIDLKKLDFRS